MKPEETRRDPESWYGRIKSGRIKFSNVIDEYAKLKGLTFDEAKVELEKRPYGRPL